ncbi:MAG: SUMF1/EgtB/PvdO family nonheme iron enzyme, partial [Bacteroidota bacterium]
YNVFREKELDKAPEGGTWDADAVTRPSPPYEDPTFGMGTNGYPAVSMTQFSALKFCKWLSDKTGRFYRLPTEAEWEYACRAGTTTAFSFGDDIDQLDEYAWHFDNSDEKYHKVGSKKPNPWGLYDMHGNVSEWTLDQYDAAFYQQLADKDGNIENPWREPTSLYPRTVKGGSWDDSKEDHRSASRISSSPRWKERDPQIPKSFWWNTDSPFVGFRLLSPAEQPSPEAQAAFWAKVFGD